MNKSLFEIEKSLIFLSSHEQELLNAFLFRKYKKHPDYKANESNLLSQIRNVIESKSVKRPEENYKFTFNFVFKQMKKAIKKKNNLNKKIRKKEVEKLFYEHYFKDIAARE